MDFGLFFCSKVASSLCKQKDAQALLEIRYIGHSEQINIRTLQYGVLETVKFSSRPNTPVINSK